MSVCKITIHSNCFCYVVVWGRHLNCLKDSHNWIICYCITRKVITSFEHGHMGAIVLSKKTCQCTRSFTANPLTRWMHSGTDLTLNKTFDCENALKFSLGSSEGFYPKISMKWKQCLKCAQREHGSWCSQAGVRKFIAPEHIFVPFKFENFIIRLYSGPFVGRKWIWSNGNRESVFTSLGWWWWSDLYWWRMDLQQALISTFTTFIIRDQSINFAQCFYRNLPFNNRGRWHF